MKKIVIKKLIVISCFLVILKLVFLIIFKVIKKIVKWICEMKINFFIRIEFIC